MKIRHELVQNILGHNEIYYFATKRFWIFKQYFTKEIGWNRDGIYTRFKNKSDLLKALKIINQSK
jgi:hypothetical protein